jgi:hypothetical protein
MIFSKNFVKIQMVFSLTVLVIGISACQNAKMDRKDRVAAMVGTMQDPFIAATFTPQILIDKSGMNEGALPFTYQAFASFFMSEEKTGIDNHAQVQVVVENSGGMVPNAFAFITVKNANQFKKLVEKELSAKVQEKNGAYYFRKDEDNYVVAWKDDIAIMTNIPLSLDNLFSKGITESKKTAIRLVNMLTEVAKKNINASFRAFFEKEGDVRCYVNGTSTYDLIESMRFISKNDKAELKQLLSGTTMESVLNFEAGSINLNIDYELADSLKMYANVLSEKPISVDLLQYGLTSKPMMAIAISLSPENFVKLMKRQRDFMDTDGLEKELRAMDMTLDDLPNVITGEILVMLDGLDSVSHTYTSYSGEEVSYKNYEPRIATIIGLKDVNKIKFGITKMLAGTNDSSKIEEMYYHFSGNRLVLVSSVDWLSVIKNGNAKAIDQKNLLSNGLGIYLNPKMGEKLDFDMTEFGVIQEEMIDLIGGMNNSGGQLTIKLKDANKNALRTILEKLIEAYERNEKMLNSDLEATLNEELMDQIESEVEASVEELINSDEMKAPEKAIKKL